MKAPKKSAKPSAKFQDTGRLKASSKRAKAKPDPVQESSPTPFTVHAVTCGGQYVKANSELDELQAYVDAYNKFRKQSNPPAVISKVWSAPVKSDGIPNTGFNVLDQDGTFVKNYDRAVDAAAFLGGFGQGKVVDAESGWDIVIPEPSTGKPRKSESLPLFVIHAVFCGGAFVMASDKQYEIDAYVKTFNRLRKRGTPPAVVKTITVQPN